MRAILPQLTRQEPEQGQAQGQGLRRDPEALQVEQEQEELKQHRSVDADDPVRSIVLAAEPPTSLLHRLIAAVAAQQLRDPQKYLAAKDIIPDAPTRDEMKALGAELRQNSCPLRVQYKGQWYQGSGERDYSFTGRGERRGQKLIQSWEDLRPKPLSLTTPLDPALLGVCPEWFRRTVNP
jgi:hypothetical protein